MSAVSIEEMSYILSCAFRTLRRFSAPQRAIGVCGGTRLGAISDFAREAGVIIQRCPVRTASYVM